MDIFTPQSGLVLDPFSGIMTTGNSAQLSGRPCVLLEKESDLHRDAVKRVRKLLRDQAFVKPTDQIIIRNLCQSRVQKKQLGFRCQKKICWHRKMMSHSQQNMANRYHNSLHKTLQKAVLKTIAGQKVRHPSSKLSLSHLQRESAYHLHHLCKKCVAQHEPRKDQSISLQEMCRTTRGTKRSKHNTMTGSKMCRLKIA